MTTPELDMRCITQLASKRFRLRMKVFGKKVDRVHSTLEDAQQMRDAIWREAADETMVPVDGESPKTLGSSFLTSRKGHATYNDQKGRWDLHIATAAFAVKPLRTIEASDVHRWLDKLKHKATSRTGRPNNPLKLQTRRHCLNLLRAFFKWTRERGLIETNPCAGITIERSRDDDEDGWSPEWFLDQEDQAKLLVACRKRGGDEALLVQFALGCGIRLDELFCLHLSDVHLEGKNPYVEIKYGSWNAKEKRFNPPKGRRGFAKPRKVMLFGLALKAAREWVQVLETRKNERGLFFPSPRGGKRTKPPRWFTKHVTNDVVIPRLKRKIWWHLLRHSFATSLANAHWGKRWDPRDIATMLGHQNDATTRRYAHETEGPILEIVAATDAAWRERCHADDTTPKNAGTNGKLRVPSKPQVIGSTPIGRTTGFWGNGTGFATYVILTYTVSVEVLVTRRAEKSLRKAPRTIAAGFFVWKLEVETQGIETVRKIPGYHDEPLGGKLKGIVRSVRLSDAYRIYYRIVGTKVRCISVEEVNRHDYKAIERLFGL